MYLLDNEKTLLYKTVKSGPARFLRIVCYPAIGKACLKTGHIFKLSRGMERKWDLDTDS